MKLNSAVKKDMAMDKRSGIKEGSARDVKLDSKVKGSLSKASTTKTSKHASTNQHGNSATKSTGSAKRINGSHPAGRSGDKVSAKMSAQSTNKTPMKAANSTLMQRIANKKLFAD